MSAQAEQFIAGLPRGYETTVGTDQDAFSGGQAQRIALAREFLREPKVLVMDEATSQLDAGTERNVLSNPSPCLSRDNMPCSFAPPGFGDRLRSHSGSRGWQSHRVRSTLT